MNIIKGSNIMLPFILSDELHRLLDKRMHITVIVYERNDLAVFRKDLLDGP